MTADSAWVVTAPPSGVVIAKQEGGGDVYLRDGEFLPDTTTKAHREHLESLGYVKRAGSSKSDSKPKSKPNTTH